ncbi:MAG TPA: MFS transporter [Steroidobacteraceae bacterium]|nr:MFS transporter [Steroidobacteraceae bacterium]
MQQEVSISPADASEGLALWVSVLGFLIMTTDGYDLQAAAFAAPALAAEWHVKRELLGPVLAASIVGMAFGSVALGWLGDRVGRKKALVVCMALLALGSLGSWHASSLTPLWWFRALTGLGLGGATPIATTLIAEWTPPRWRTVAVAVVIVGVPLGGLVGAAVAQYIIPAYGWRSVFLLGAALPAAFLVIAVPLLPESPAFRARAVAGAGAATGVAPRHALQGLFDLVAPPNLFATLTIWGSFILNSLTLYGFVNWLPLVLSSAGLPLQAALRGSLLFNLGGVVGSVCGSILIARYGSRPIGTSIAATGSVGAILVGVALIVSGHGGAAMVLAPIALAGACLNGMQNFLYAVAAHAYPTDIRASGVGCASAVARVGGVLSSAVGSSYFAFGLPVAQFFYILAVFIAATAACFFCIPRHIPRAVA